MLRVCCAASQRCCAVIVRPDTDPSWEAPAPWLPRRLPSGCTGQAVEVPRVLAWGDVKKSPCSPWSKLLQTPGLLRSFMQPQGVINLSGGLALSWEIPRWSCLGCRWEGEWEIAQPSLWFCWGWAGAVQPCKLCWKTQSLLGESSAGSRDFILRRIEWLLMSVNKY